MLNISLVAFLGLCSTREWGIRILQPLSDIYTFPSSKNFLTTPFSKPLIPYSFVFSRLIISRLFSDRGGQKLGARGISPWSSNIKILLCSPIYTLTRRTWGWGWTKGWKRHSRSEVVIERYIESVVQWLCLESWCLCCELCAVNCIYIVIREQRAHTYLGALERCLYPYYYLL